MANVTITVNSDHRVSDLHPFATFGDFQGDNHIYIIVCSNKMTLLPNIEGVKGVLKEEYNIEDQVHTKTEH